MVNIQSKLLLRKIPKYILLKLLTLNNKYSFLLVLISVLIPLLFINNIYLLIPISIIIFFVIFDFKPTIITVLFVALIALSSGLGDNLRLFIQVITVTTLTFIFFKQYGIQFERYPKLPAQMIKLILLILFAMVFSLPFTKYFMVGIEQLVRSVLFFFIIYLFYSFLSDFNDVKYFLYALFGGAVIYFILLLYEIVKVDFDFINLNQSIFLNEGISFVHRNVIGGFFSICIAITIAFLTSEGLKQKYRKYFATFITFLTLGLVLTNSRGAIISLIIAAVYIFYIQNKKALKYLVAIILLIIPFLFLNIVSDTINLYFRLERISTGRDYILETVYNMISNNPIIGAGPAATKFEMYNYLPYLFGTPQEFYLSKHINQIEFGHAHNFYLFLYTDLGIIGLITSLLIPFTFVRMGNTLMKSVNKNETILYPLILGIQAAGISLFIRGLFEWAGIFSYGTITYDLPFWWIFSILVFLYQKIIIDKQKIILN